MLALAVAAAGPSAVLYTNERVKLSVCVAYKAGSTQWRLLFSALLMQQHGLIDFASLRPEQFGPEESFSASATRREESAQTRSFTWQSFYDATADLAWRHVHFLREPLERTASAYLDRCVRAKWDICNHAAFGTAGGAARNWTASREDVRDFLLNRIGRARAWFDARGKQPFSSFEGSVDDHFQTQMLRCANYGLGRRRGGGSLPWFFNSSVAWEGTTGLARPALQICGERNVPNHICDAAFPATSQTTHATGAAAQLERLFSVDELRELRDAVYAAYPKDHLVYERYRRSAALWMSRPSSKPATSSSSPTSSSPPQPSLSPPPPQPPQRLPPPPPAQSPARERDVAKGFGAEVPTTTRAATTRWSPHGQPPRRPPPSQPPDSQTPSTSPLPGEWMLLAAARVVLALEAAAAVVALFLCRRRALCADKTVSH